MSVNIKTFIGRNSKEALQKVRNELGDSAVIISNRQTSNGVEVIAIPPNQIPDEIINREFKPSYQYVAPQNKVDEVMAILTAKPKDKANYTQSIELAEDAEPKKPAYVFEPPAAEEPKAPVAPAYQFEPAPKEPVYFKPSFNTFEHQHVQRREAAITSVITPVVKPEASVDKSSEQESESFNSNEQVLRAKVLASQPSTVVTELIEPEPVQQAKQMMAGVSNQEVITSQDIQTIFTELRSLRSDMEARMGEMSINNQQRHPAKRHLLKSMLGAGFGGGIARFFVENMPQEMSAAEGAKWAQSIIAHNLKVEKDESEILDKGGVFALVGPTGVGKTTTIAKLAARFVMRHGTSKLAFITTDAYRIGGHEQLRIYGKILGVMVHAVKDESDLKMVLEELRGKHTILIDTVGVSQRDKMVAQQIALLNKSDRPIKKLLCLNATSTRDTLVDVIGAYRSDIQGGGIDGCVVTKIDEAASIGNVLDVILQSKLKIYFMTNGQRVPEDIMYADKAWLSANAFKNNPLVKAPSMQYVEDQLPMLANNQLSNSNSLEVINA